MTCGRGAPRPYLSEMGAGVVGGRDPAVAGQGDVVRCKDSVQ
jgi:hypothetical protein